MKKIINGARYDTSTAKFLGNDSYSHPGDLYWQSESLYRTKSGKYFLHGEGGAASRYAEAINANNWSGGEQILPMVEADALAWAEEHLTGEEVEAAFTIPAEDTTAVTAYLPDSVLAALDARKKTDSASRTDVIISALRAYL